MRLLLWFPVIVFLSCQSTQRLPLPMASPGRMSGTTFYKTVAAFDWKKRDSVAVEEILSGNIPTFLTKLMPVTTIIADSVSGKKISATFYVTSDYLSIGNDDDWARVPLTPMAAQRIADSFNCFLPTRKMVDDIYKAAVVKLEPVPMYAFRDSSPTMYQHHLIIEGQRKGNSGLIAGIKKDVVISERIAKEKQPDRVAIYGWHKLDGKPIQPLYTRHANWYADYSHGIRLVYRKIKVDGQWMDYTDVLKHPQLKRLLCDEERCDVFQYDY